MNSDRNVMTQKILDLTLEIINLLTGEDHIVVKIPGESVTERGSCEGLCISQSPSMEEKILELSNQIIRLLTGEVPIRCEDVTVYLSMEEWEYVERHKELYEDIMMEDHQPDHSVSGDFHPPDSLPDFGSNNKTGKTTNNGKKYWKIISLSKGRAASSTHTERESLAMELKHVSEKELHPTTEHSQTRYSPDDIKEEPASCDDGNLSDTDMYEPINHTQTGYATVLLKAESDSYDGDITDSDLYKPPEHTQTVHACASAEECLKANASPFIITPSKSLLKPRKYDGSIYSTVDDSQPISINPDLISHNLASKGILVSSSESGKVLCSESEPVLHETNCREGNGLTRRSDLNEHQKAHAVAQPFSCSECEKRFTHRIALQMHQRIHRRSKLFKCTECDKCFTLHYKLVRHQRRHTGEKPFKCAECGKCFAIKSILSMHAKIHTGERPFKCTECGKCFTRATHLASHKIIHTGEKTFKCPECGKWFSLKTQLNKHMKTHTKEKPFKCVECGAGFIHPSDFTVHKMIHTGEKPFSCTECGKRFRRKGNLNRHQKIHTKKNPHERSVVDTATISFYTGVNLRAGGLETQDDLTCSLSHGDKYPG